MFKTLKNAWGIMDLRKKILFTLLIVVLYRLGAQIPVPFVSADLLASSDAFKGTILQYLNIISGEALGKATLLALGVSPYITASIVVQLLTIAIPKLEQWAKEGEEGKKKINVVTRIITVVLALVTSIGYVMFLDGGNGSTSYLNVESPNFFHYTIITLCYCAGAAIVMWLAEKINESGIGNGISIILFANIIAGVFSTASVMWSTVFPKGNFKSFDWLGLIVALAFLVVLLGLILVVVWMSDAERRIPIAYAKRVVGRKMYGGQNTNLPLKVNMTGVMPIIFANSIVTIPATLALVLDNLTSWKWVEKFSDWLGKWFNYDSWIYLVIFMGLLIAFAYFYVMISFNPVEVANNIKNNGGAIPGIRSGRPTIEYIKKVLYRITLVGALLVVFVACFPMLLNNICSLDVIQNALKEAGRVPEYYMSLFATLAFGGSSLMIVVGVALETTRELEAQMTLRNYKGFLD